MIHNINLTNTEHLVLASVLLWHAVQVVTQRFFPVRLNCSLYPQGIVIISLFSFQLQHVVTMDLVHLAHLIIVRVQIIRQAFKQISLQVRRNETLWNKKMFIFLCRSYEKHVSVRRCSTSLVFTDIAVKKTKGMCCVSREMRFDWKSDNLLNK